MGYVKGVHTQSNTGGLFDNKRLGYNVDDNPLYANLSSAEGSQDAI